eukprot:SAG25_NODE_6123_length_586_cov_1.032854_1_plen_195_part_11
MAMAYRKRAGSIAVVRLLLERGADPCRIDSRESTPLMMAAGDEDVDMLQLLLARDVPVDTVDACGSTAFHLACLQSQVECVEALVRAGCDMGLRDRDGATGRDYAITAREHDTTAVLAWLDSPAAAEAAAVGARVRQARAAAASQDGNVMEMIKHGDSSSSSSSSSSAMAALLRSLNLQQWCTVMDANEVDIDVL